MSSELRAFVASICVRTTPPPEMAYVHQLVSEADLMTSPELRTLITACYADILDIDGGADMPRFMAATWLIGLEVGILWGRRHPRRAHRTDTAAAGRRR